MLARARFLVARRWLRDPVALALLAGLALAACGFLLRDDLFIFGDHPGQFIRFWYPVRVSHRLLGWNPLWYAGYPELQFYPPGFVLLGWVLDWLTLRALSPFALYQLLLFLAYLLPGVTVYALIKQVSGRRWVGLVAGILALIFPELWGGATAVFVGLVAERLAFGLVPLAMLVGWQALHDSVQTAHPRRALRWWLLASLALAATLLMHPFHAVAPVLFLGLTALSMKDRWQLLRNLAVSCALALALVAFWLLPLLIHRQYAAPMLRANLDQVMDWLLDPNMRPYLIASLSIVVLLFAQRDRALYRFVGSIVVMAVALVAFILFDHLVLIDMLGFYLLDPVRFSAEVYLAVVLLAGLGLGSVPIWLSRGWKHRGGWLLGGLAAALALIWLARPFIDLLRDQRDPAHFLEQARQDYALDAAWEELKGGEGRVLFTSHYLHLGEVPTALKAATPYFTGREIVGGTFSHWSPVARLLWVGNTDVDLLPGQVELIDDVSLAGRVWADWTDADLYDLCRRLDVTTVVATWDDITARTFLDGAPHFQSFYSDGLFVLYRVLDYQSVVAEAQGAAVIVERITPTSLDLSVVGALATAGLSVKITDYPLWRVQAGERRLLHQADEMGLMDLSLPPGSYDLALRYAAGPAERIGAWVTAGAVALWLLILALTFVGKIRDRNNDRR
jgi:hypothetical protein